MEPQNAPLLPSAPGAHSLSDFPHPQARDAMASIFGTAMHTFICAAAETLNADANRREEPGRFDNNFLPDGEKRWQTFANMTSAEPEKGVRGVATVAQDAKLMGGAYPFIAVVNLITATGKLDAVDPVGVLARHPYREARIVALMKEVTKAMAPLLAQPPLDRDLNYPSLILERFEHVVGKDRVADGGLRLATLFVQFYKALAWLLAISSWEPEHCTVNRAAMLAAIGQMQAVCAGTPGVALDVYYLMLNQTVAAVTRMKATAAAAAAAPAILTAPTSRAAVVRRPGMASVPIILPAAKTAKKATTKAKPAAAATATAPKAAAAAKPPAAAAKPAAAAAAKPAAAAAAKPAVATKKAAPAATAAAVAATAAVDDEALLAALSDM